MGFVAWFFEKVTEFKLCVHACAFVFCVWFFCIGLLWLENIVPTVDYKNHNLICREWLNFEYPKHFKLIMKEIKPVHEETFYIF